MNADQNAQVDEQAARAAYEQHKARVRRFYFDWDNLPEERKEHWRKVAQAVITAVGRQNER